MKFDVFMIIAGILTAHVQLAQATELEETKYYFLKRNAVGSDSTFGPASVFFNTGFDILRNGSYRNSLTEIDYWTGFENIYDNILDVNKSVQRSGGWGEFVAHEVFPYKAFDLSHGHFVPNYFLHVFGEGMLYRKLEEWYTEKKYPWPRVLALGTMFVTQYVNEVVENGSYRGANNDPVADIVFFNPLGWLIFSFDEVARFFSEDITIGFWPGQPSLDLSSFSLYNAGESYFYRGGFDFMGPISLFGYMGTEGVGGFSWKFDETDSLSVAAGYRMIWMKQVGDENYRRMRPIEPGNWLATVFWDRDDSLLFSAKLGIGAEPTIRINLYPGIINLKPIQIGGFLWASKSEGLITGISFSISPIGLSVQTVGDQSRAVF